VDREELEETIVLDFAQFSVEIVSGVFSMFVYVCCRNAPRSSLHAF
jgi:hypothetical protein